MKLCVKVGRNFVGRDDKVTVKEKNVFFDVSFVEDEVFVRCSHLNPFDSAVVGDGVVIILSFLMMIFHCNGASGDGSDR